MAAPFVHRQIPHGFVLVFSDGRIPFPGGLTIICILSECSCLSVDRRPTVRWPEHQMKWFANPGCAAGSRSYLLWGEGGWWGKHSISWMWHAGYHQDHKETGRVPLRWRSTSLLSEEDGGNSIGRSSSTGISSFVHENVRKGWRSGANRQTLTSTVKAGPGQTGKVVNDNFICSFINWKYN